MSVSTVTETGASVTAPTQTPAAAPAPELPKKFLHRSTAKRWVREAIRQHPGANANLIKVIMAAAHPGYAWPKDIIHIVLIEGVQLKLRQVGVTNNLVE